MPEMALQALPAVAGEPGDNFPSGWTQTAFRGSWGFLADSARVTFYGREYVAGMSTASGAAYDPASTLALGPALLALAREATGQQWGMRVRVTDLATGRSAVYQVTDTGTPQLEVDIGDLGWLEFGYPARQGVFWAKLEILK